MELNQSNSPHVFSAIVNIIILTFLPVFFYFAVIFTTADIGGSLNLVIIPCSNLIISTLFTLAIFYPSSKLLDWLFQKARENGQSKIDPFVFSAAALLLIFGLIIGGFIFVISIVLEKPFVSQYLGEQDVDSVMVWLFSFLFLGGVPLFLGGSMYWFLLQLSRKFLKR